MSRHRHNTRPQATALGGGGKFGYFMRKAVANLRANRLVTFLTITTVTLALLIISLFMLVYLNMEGSIEQWSKKVVVTVYLEKEPQPQELVSLKNRISSIVGTESVSYVSREEALKRFRSRLKGQESLLEGVSADVLPASLEISLRKEYRSSEAVTLYAGRLKRVQGVGEVQYGEEWVKKFLTFFSFLRLTGLLVAMFLLFAVTFIVGNTIRLTVMARKDELEIMALVGATPFFIKAPFLLEGMIQGGVGALIALLVLGGSYYAFLANSVNFLSFNPADAGFTFLPISHMATIFIGGLLIGFIGSLTSLKKLITI